MKKIVPRLLIVSSQILIGTLFGLFSICSRDKVELKTYSKQMTSLSKFVYNEKTNDEEIFIENIEVVKIEDNISTIENGKLEKENNYFIDKEVINSFTGILTGYGPDCVGCGNFNTNKVSTASGYHIANIVDGAIEPAFTITYDDGEYGEVRIVAGDSTLPFKTIVRITIPDNEPIIAIVLDRGSTVGIENCRSQRGCLTNFDLLYPTEAESLGKTYNVLFEILRMGE